MPNDWKPFTMVWKEGMVVKNGIVNARDADYAERSAREYCSQEVGRRFIRIENPVVCDESILVDHPQADIEWDALGAIDRLASMRNITREEVIEQLKSKRRPSQLAPVPAVPKVVEELNAPQRPAPAQPGASR